MEGVQGRGRIWRYRASLLRMREWRGGPTPDPETRGLDCPATCCNPLARDPEFVDAIRVPTGGKPTSPLQTQTSKAGNEPKSKLRTAIPPRAPAFALRRHHPRPRWPGYGSTGFKDNRRPGAEVRAGEAGGGVTSHPKLREPATCKSRQSTAPLPLHRCAERQRGPHYPETEHGEGPGPRPDPKLVRRPNIQIIPGERWPEQRGPLSRIREWSEFHTPVRIRR
jgi:hypothetical protein